MLLVANLTSVACVVGAAWVAGQGKDGWGWMLFAAVALHSLPRAAQP